MSKKKNTNKIKISDLRDTESKIRLFADDCVCYPEIDSIDDTLTLQKDIDQLSMLALFRAHME